MPELSLHLRIWTGTYTSPPYPHEIAVAVGAVQASQLDIAAAVLTGLSPVLHDGSFDVDRLAARTRAAWSAPEPVAQLRSLAGAAERTAGTIDRLRDTLLPAIEDVREAQAIVAAAIDNANSATDWSQNYVALGTPEADLRIAICRSLKQTLQPQYDRVQATLAALADVVHLDPQDAIPALPTGGSPSAPPRASATDAVSERNLARLADDLVSDDSARRTFAVGVLAGLHRAAGDGGASQLLIYDPDAFNGQGRAAISVGGLDSADHVAILTPGIGNSPDDLNPTAVLARDLISRAEAVAPGESTAVVLWFGYDIPCSDRTGSIAGWVNDRFRATNDDAAREGAPLLAADTEWIARLAARGATMTLIGHSMGSTATSEAARLPLPVDTMVMLGSPGAGNDVRTAHDYAGLDDHNVFVVSHEQDAVTRSELDGGAVLLAGPRGTLPFGPDPADSSFGAQLVDAPSTAGNLQIPGLGVDLLAQHSMTNYLTGPAGTAVAMVITGRTSQIKRRTGR
jgi:hypothetical protein